jgi:hypothetical protein
MCCPICGGDTDVWDVLGRCPACSTFGNASLEKLSLPEFSTDEFRYIIMVPYLATA